jgi:hypothetical protein
LASARLPSLPLPFRCRSLFHWPARTVSICAAPPPGLRALGSTGGMGPQALP